MARREVSEPVVVVMNEILFQIYMRFHLAFRDEYGDLMEDFDMVFKTYLKKVSKYTSS